MAPPGMDGRTYHNGGHNVTPRLEWPQTQSQTLAADSSSRGMERASINNLRTSFRSNLPPNPTIRAVTPEYHHPEVSPAVSASSVFDPAASLHSARSGFTSTSPQTSPRSIPGDFQRRQGVVFNDQYGGDSYQNSSSPPPRQPNTFRPRTHTMDGALRQQFLNATAREGPGRPRLGSFSSSGSQPLYDDARSPPPPIESLGFPSVIPARHSEIPPGATNSLREKKSSSKRLIKRQSSRPTSPPATTPSVDSLPVPVPTENANNILLLMKNLCGRMRGDIEFRTETSGHWQIGVAYVDEEKGSLMFDSGNDGPFHVPLVSDLRGCRISPTELPEGKKCLEISSNAQPPVDLLIHPILAEERDLWLAALLCWQQMRPPKVKLSNANRNPTPTQLRPAVRRRGSENGTPKTTNALIKVGQVRLWDKGLASSPRAIVKRPSTRDLRSPCTSWRVVSCLLQENGEIRLTTNDGDAVIAVVELSQLSRCAIQQLDRSVLDEEYCIGIFPHYSTISTQLSIFRPVYIALENRLLFEVWFVLLRAFALPDIFLLEPSAEGAVEVTDLDSDLTGEVFRIEKTISLRVTEAKLKPRIMSPDVGSFVDRQSRDADPLIGNYLTEVILDGEVRARSTIKTGTKNPFWREDYQFSDLPPMMPFLSIVLKRVDGNLESWSHQLQASLGLPKTGNLTEVLCGSVDIPLDQVEPGKDLERWLDIYDERQQVVGTMLVKLQHEELVVLHSKEYQALSTLLHSFPSGLTAQIADALPGNLRRLSEIFLNIFQVSNHANEWLQTLVEDEIDGIGGTQNQMKKYRYSSRLKSSEALEFHNGREQVLRDMGKSLAGEANLLFRGNTLLTQALEFHMRRSGKEYLEQMLMAKIYEINEMNPDCEVDPSKLKPGENVQEHWNRLIQITTEVWQCICREPTKCPPELRSILKYIRAVAEDRYGDWLRTVTYTSVSGFLFLRFICPAILSPKLFGLLRDHPRPRAQRTLTLVAKALQALGNLSTFGKKEEWMEPMNKFLGSNRQSVKDYIDTICSIPVERNKVALGPSYSTPITILGRLSPTAREGFPALPHLIDHARNFAALVKMWTDANPIGNGEVSKPAGGEDDILIFNEMCMSLQERADICYAKMDGSLHDTASLAASASEFADQLEHSQAMLESMTFATYHNNNSATNSTTASTVWMEQDNLVPPGSAGSDAYMETSSSRSREQRRGRDRSSMRQNSGHSDHSTGHLATLKRNGRATRHILSGIMKPFARGESPDSSPSVSRSKNFERNWNTGY
ncbi:putative Ras GTPase-activating-like protein ngap [Colletotrichum gloeosporioides]|uniref:Putative Ras GTPase-activating-like protein ngap n=1 Tax=Colletotrichum gloeosporioides TaxID=474922 RepID=A0A8H4FP40_COLGL|nr:putative Ras GTPase-activating-like protein ngap [Colletotrichum gloeosporioides]KAF3809270.1 putative Ras GTPase-activating-like protein ngap [Colletotrichum gloeosporioides]